MWPNGFWPDNFWPNNFWIEGETPPVPIGGNLILVDGSVAFDITLDGDFPVSRGVVKGHFTSPVQDSFGGLIRLAHNFPYQAGNIAKIGYESPTGKFGELICSSFDSDYARAIIPEGLFDLEGKYWKFNIIAEGVRNTIPFSIRSRKLQVEILDGLIDETNN